jgi:hypothetical protein
MWALSSLGITRLRTEVAGAMVRDLTRREDGGLDQERCQNRCARVDVWGCRCHLLEAALV